MQSVITARSEIGINGDQVLHCRNLGREDDPVAWEPDLLGALRRQKRRLHHRLAGDLARIARIVGTRILVHQMGKELLIERTPVGSDAHRLPMLDRGLYDRAELAVLLFLES